MGVLGDGEDLFVVFVAEPKMRSSKSMIYEARKVNDKKRKDKKIKTEILDLCKTHEKSIIRLQFLLTKTL